MLSWKMHHKVNVKWCCQNEVYVKETAKQRWLKFCTFTLKNVLFELFSRSLSIPITMRALIRHGQCRIKSDPEPEPEMTSLLNGNVRDPNQVKIPRRLFELFGAKQFT